MTITGHWRSWLARLYDTQEVTGSSPVWPTSKDGSRSSRGAAAFVAGSLDRLARTPTPRFVPRDPRLIEDESRRTGTDNIRLLRERLAALPAAEVWDLEGENPYFGYLGLADHIVVTADSANMVSEAAATGKPVQVVELKGGNRKFREFHEAMRAAGYCRPFEGRLESWTYDPLDETGRVAAEVKRRLAARG